MWLYYFCKVKKIINYLIFIFPLTLQAQDTDWVAQQISGSITVYFPAQAGYKDTVGQSMYYLLEGKDLMLATVAPIPKTILLEKDYNKDSVLNNFINSVIQNAKQLIFSDVEYKGLSAKFYKVRVEDPLNEIQGLITDSYNFIYQDTIYSISYLRYKATDLYDYTRQRLFFDRVEIQQSTFTSNYDSNTFQPIELNKTNDSNSNNSTLKFIGIAFLIIAITFGIYFYQSRRKKE